MLHVFELRNLNSLESFPLDKPENILGRSQGADIVVASEEASRRHAELKYRDDELLLQDLESTNGTFVNNRQIYAATPVKSGDVIAIGDQKFRVALTAGADNSTIFGARISDENSYVLEQAAPDSTSIRQGFAMPPGWSSEDRASFSGSRSRDESALDQRLRVQGADPAIYAAAFLTLSGKGDKPLYLLSRVGSGDKWAVGRSRACDLNIDDFTVSNHHATLMYADGEWSVEDRGSTNGVKINGTRSQYAIIRSGDRVSFGEVELLFRAL